MKILYQMKCFGLRPLLKGNEKPSHSLVKTLLVCEWFSVFLSDLCNLKFKIFSGVSPPYYLRIIKIIKIFSKFSQII